MCAGIAVPSITIYRTLEKIKNPNSFLFKKLINNSKRRISRIKSKESAPKGCGFEKSPHRGDKALPPNRGRAGGVAPPL